MLLKEIKKGRKKGQWGDKMKTTEEKFPEIQ